MNNKYISIRTPDKMRLANYINRAKGPERTMAQFAELCKVSASALSRAVNGKIAKPLSEELIKAIVENAAEEIPLDMIMSANGMVDEESYKKRNEAMHGHFLYRQAHIDRENIAKNIISTELLNRGNLIRYFNRLPSRSDRASKFRLRMNSTFALWVENKEKYMWNFILYPQQAEDEREKRMMQMRIMERMNSIFLMDAWEPEMLEGLRTSMVFVDKSFYEDQVEILKNASLNSDISLILLDTEKECVVDEFAIPRRDGKEYKYEFNVEVSQPETFEFWNGDYEDEDFE